MIPLARVRKEYLTCRSLLMQVKPDMVDEVHARHRLARIARTGPYYRVRQEPNGRVLVFSRPSRGYWITDALGGEVFSEASPGRPLTKIAHAIALRRGLEESAFAGEVIRLFSSLGACPEVPLDFPLATPLRAAWRITEHCNLDCLHCFNRAHPSRVATRGEIDRVADELRAAGVFEVILSGGEPLSHPDLPVILERLRDFGVTIFTNGTLVESRIAELEQFDIRWLVSLDGFEAEHDHLRGAGAWRRTMRGIEALEKAHFPVTINCVVSALNLDIAERFVDHHRALQRHVQLSFLVPIGTAEAHPKMHLREEHRPRLEALLARYRTGTRSLNENRFICGGGRTKIDVGVNGRVVPCSFSTTFDLGNLHEMSLRDVWGSPNRTAFRDYLGPDVISGACRVVREAYGESFSP
jgi:MoaA/NifB/PqqE/SkfB family radical SAM enzyme